MEMGAELKRVLKTFIQNRTDCQLEKFVTWLSHNVGVADGLLDIVKEEYNIRHVAFPKIGKACKSSFIE